MRTEPRTYDAVALAQLDELLARSPLALIGWDANFRITYWSRSASDMFGYEREAVLGKTLAEFSFVPPEDVDTVRDLQRRLDISTRDRAIININRNRHRSGETLTCRWTTFAVQEHDPHFHILSYVEDITETVNAQALLSESEERFRSLFEHNPEIIMIFGRDGTILDVNHAVTRFGPARREEIIGLHFSAFLHPDDVPRHDEYLRRALEGETLYYHARAHTLQGRPLEVSITTIPTYNAGKIEAAFSIIRDETDRRAAQARIERQERELHDSEARLRSLFEHNPDGVLALALDGTITDVNDACLRIGNFPREGVIGEHFNRFLPDEDRAGVDHAFARAVAGEPTTVKMRSFRIDGSSVEIDGTLIPQYANGRVVGVYTIVQDVTERNAAERLALMQSQRMRSLYFIAASGDYPDVRMRASLEMGCQALDLSTGAVVELIDGARIEAIFREPSYAGVDDETILDVARSVADLPGPAIPIPVANGIAMRLDVGGEVYGAVVFASCDAPERAMGSTDADLLGLIATLIAGTIDRSRQRARLRAMAYYDALTGLPNRVFLAEKLRDAIEVAQSRLGRVAVLFLDLDRFKDVNDTLGHARGDRLLQMAASRLVDQLGDRATIARMGGDEFVVLLTDTRDADAVRDIAEEIVGSMTEPFQLDEYEQFISTSIGIAVYPEDGRDDQTLIKNADIAMYRAKDRGRNGYYFYNATLEAPIHMRLSQEKLLRRALECNEFVVYFQPLIDVRTGHVVSAEALVRWQHPKSGLIEPSHFIPSAEISGLIVPLGDWILEHAAKQVRIWHDTLAPIRLAVNLSARQFHSRDLRRRVIAALEAAAFDPSFLEIEITETVAMSDAAQTVGIVRDLKAAGIRTAVDDFGTGYSSLAYLRRFALDVLKIDGSFVVGLGHEVFDETIVRTVIGMAHSLGLEVVAEGVETETQMHFLAENGCDLVQGYAIAPPLPADEFERFLIRRREASPASG
ncbi:MAG TPA: EAL domain-containing protein [Candidatus Aquilonibacter sp.]|nr:EAL domain-containing protein [Candidatus Aquilonibacter sp.]